MNYCSLLMSPRPFRLRKISNPPVISGFKPYGLEKNATKPESVFLHLEEYEALRLCDYEMLNHHQAAILMAGIKTNPYPDIFKGQAENSRSARSWQTDYYPGWKDLF